MLFSKARNLLTRQRYRGRCAGWENQEREGARWRGVIGGGHELEVDVCDFQDSLYPFSIRRPFFITAQDLNKGKISYLPL